MTQLLASCQHLSTGRSDGTDSWPPTDSWIVFILDSISEQPHAGEEAAQNDTTDLRLVKNGTVPYIGWCCQPWALG